MSESRYVVRPRADQDLDDQAYYYATVANAELGHRFLVAAHSTIAQRCGDSAVVHGSRNLQALLHREGLE